MRQLFARVDGFAPVTKEEVEFLVKVATPYREMTDEERKELSDLLYKWFPHSNGYIPGSELEYVAMDYGIEFNHGLEDIDF